VARVHQDLEPGRRGQQQPARLQLQRAGELAGEVLEPRPELEAFRTARFPPGQLQHVVDDLAHALGVRADDLGQPHVFRAQRFRFGEELPGVAHRADRVANLVRDAGGQATQRGEFRLLDTRVHVARVLQEDEDRAVALSALAEHRQVRHEPHAAPVGEQRELDVRASLGFPAPRGDVVGERRRDVADRHACAGGRCSEQARRRCVDQAHAIRGVEDHDALAQVLDDVVVELREVREIDAALGGERFARLEAVGERPRRHRDREDDRPEHARRGVAARVGEAGHLRKELLAQYRERRQRGEGRRDLQRHDQAARADEHDEQASEPAPEPAARMHEGDHRGDVDRDLGDRERPRRRPALPDRETRDRREHEITGSRRGEQAGIAAAEDAVLGGGEEEGQQHGGEQQAERVQRSDHPPGQVRLFEHRLPQQVAAALCARVRHARLVNRRGPLPIPRAQ
jgi:hypothetical protein